MKSSQIRQVVMIAGPCAALLVGAVTSSMRDQVGATDAGIMLAILVVLAALSSRLAGLATAVVATLAFNFFHSPPYHSLRMHRSSDVMIAGLLVVLGLVVSDVTAWRRRRDAIDVGHRSATDAPRLLTEMLAMPHAVSDVWPAITISIMDQLRLAECSFDPSPHTDLPLISRRERPAADGDDGFVLPSRGAAIPLTAGSHALGHLVVRPANGITSLWVERRVVLALADHLAIALTYTGHAANGTAVPRAD